MRRLIEICAQEQRCRKEAELVIDCSQRGNGEYWRNVRLDGNPYKLECNGPAPIPDRGCLTMECATMLRPPSDAEELGMFFPLHTDACSQCLPQGPIV